MHLSACNVAKLANKYAIEYKGTLLTNADCDAISAEVAAKFGGGPLLVRVFCLNPQSQNTTNNTAWNVNATSSNSSESVIPRPELLGCPGRMVPGCPSQSTAAQRVSATTGITTYYGVGQVKSGDNCALEQVLKIAVSRLLT